MMLHRLPEPDLGEEKTLTAMRAAHEAAGQHLARGTLMAAARLARKVWGENAALLLSEKGIGDDERTDITLLLVLDQAGRPLWFNRVSGRHCATYPGADPAGPDVHYEVNSAIESLLAEAYDAVGGISYTWDAVSVDHFGADVNTLILNIGDTLTLKPDSRAWPWQARPAG